MSESRDWGGLRSIIDEARAIDEELKRNPSPDCPVCGEVLDVNGRGERNCINGHYRDQGTPLRPI